MTISFVRAPMQDTREALIDWLEKRGCKPPFRDVHIGPDGSWRGSGIVEVKPFLPGHYVDDGNGGYLVASEFTGRKVRRRVTYLTNDPQFGIPDGFVVMSIAPACPFAGGEWHNGKLTARHSPDCICEVDGVIR